MVRRPESVLRSRGFQHIVGIDEAGRGAAAGPLVVAAVELPPNHSRLARLRGLGDSKQLRAGQRQELATAIREIAVQCEVAVIGVDRIDDVGVGTANLDGMREALLLCQESIDYVITDGFPVTGLGVSNIGMWKADVVCPTVSAASIIAKTTRDALMDQLGVEFPTYGFADHKGYLTAHHRRALETHGPSRCHRRSFAPIARLLNQPPGPRSRRAICHS